MNEAELNAFIANMPYVIAVNYERLLEERRPQRQVELILHIYNLGLRALTSSLVSQYLIRDIKKVSDSYLTDLLVRRNFGYLQTDDWEKLFFTFLRVYKGKQDLFFMPELHDFLWDTTRLPYRYRKPSVRAPFDRLTRASLDLKKPEKEADWQALAEDLKGHLDHILHGLSFLAKYDLIRVLDQHDGVYTCDLHKGSQISTEECSSPEQTSLTPGWFYLRKSPGDFLRLHPWLMVWDKEPEGKESVLASIGVYDRMHEERLVYLLTTPGGEREDIQHVGAFFTLMDHTIIEVKRNFQGRAMTWVRLCDICEDITQKQMALPRKQLYLQRERVRDEFYTFLDSREQRGFVLVGKSGVGKSNFLLALARELQGARDDVCVLIYEGATMRVSSPPRSIEHIIRGDFAVRLDLSVHEVKDPWHEISEIDGIRGRQVIFCVDAINENKKDAPELLRQLDGLVRGSSKWLKIVFSCRPETSRDIKRGTTLDADLYYREQGSDSPEVKLERFSPEECRQAYAKYEREYELKTPYDSLSDEMQETLRDPFNLWLLADAFKRDTVETVKPSELIKFYVNALRRERTLASKDQEFLENELVPLMVREGRYSNEITEDDLSDAGLYDKIFSGHMNQSFRRLADAEILVRKDLQLGKQAIRFKYERFYEDFVGNRIAILSEKEPNRCAFFCKLIEEIAGKKGPPGEKGTTSKPFLWGAVRNALAKEATKRNSETILELCHTRDERVKDMMVDVLVTLRLDLGGQVEGILERLLPQEKKASRVQKLRRVIRKASKGSEIAFRNAGRIAIEVASRLGIATILQQALVGEDRSLRTEAVRYSYYLWQRDRDAGVLAYVAEKATAGLIPDSRAFESAFGLSVIIFFEHHKDAKVLKSLEGVWRTMIARLFRIHEGSSPWKARVGDFIRDRIVGFVISLTFRLFSLLPSYNMVSYEALEAFFELGTREKALYRRLVHYFDVHGEYTRSQMEHDYLEAIQIDNVLIMLTTLMGLVAHACDDPQVFLPFLKQLFEAAKSKVATYPYLTIISNVAMEVLYRDPMNNEMFKFFVHTAEVCQEYYAKYPPVHNRHLAEAPQSTAMAPYIIFQYRRERMVKTLWLKERIQAALEEAALEENNLPFFEHLLKMELPQVGIEHKEPRAALETMELFFQQSFNGSLEEKNRKLLQQYSIAFLSRLRIHEPDEVDAFLDNQQALLDDQKGLPDEQQALKDLRLQVSTNQPVESIGDLLGKRGWYFLRDHILLGSSAELRSQFMGLLEKAADSKNTKAWWDYNIRSLINLIYDGQVLRQPKR